MEMRHGMRQLTVCTEQDSDQLGHLECKQKLNILIIQIPVSKTTV